MYRRFVIVASIFFTVLLFTPGCGEASAAELPPNLPTARPSKPEPPLILPGATSVVPSFVKPPHDAPRKPRIPHARPLPPDTCRGQRLAPNTPGLEELGEEVRAWHICYIPPPSATSPSSLPTRFRFDLHTDQGTQTVWASDLSGDGADARTLSFLVILPARTVPAFQGWTTYEDFSSTGVIDQTPQHALVSVQGALALWRVQRSGEQDPEYPDRACLAPSPGMERSAFFLPMDQCMQHETNCLFVERLDCTQL